MRKAEATLRSAYRAFNARHIDAALERMHPRRRLAERVGGRSRGGP
jgi:hypothetical protein